LTIRRLFIEVELKIAEGGSAQEGWKSGRTLLSGQEKKIKNS